MPGMSTEHLPNLLCSVFLLLCMGSIPVRRFGGWSNSSSSSSSVLEGANIRAVPVDDASGTVLRRTTVKAHAQHPN